VPQGKLRQALMHGAHDALVAGHLGFNMPYERLRQGVTRPEMYSELKAYVRSCDSCQWNKTLNQKPIGLLKPLEIPTERFEQVSMDFITNFPVTATPGSRGLHVRRPGVQHYSSRARRRRALEDELRWR
jgi:Integrase zinc binding domain